ncbi:hypothetical protein B0T16DRAFT_411322 [Cercophora newfieldiana]|uniref:Uncharacterized protein n=1 Tax=Cercophora newfieldiana TaxID=92897 RepID=A0AA40CQG3_9PEZI|nr:hypothetical protein B0T16DRAFT_411322 [Cercophora newfieldiana]
MDVGMFMLTTCVTSVYGWGCWEGDVWIVLLDGCLVSYGWWVGRLGFGSILLFRFEMLGCLPGRFGRELRIPFSGCFWLLLVDDLMGNGFGVICK